MGARRASERVTASFQARKAAASGVASSGAIDSP
jgi:hypothetical protein